MDVSIAVKVSVKRVAMFTGNNPVANIHVKMIVKRVVKDVVKESVKMASVVHAKAVKIVNLHARELVKMQQKRIVRQMRHHLLACRLA